MAGVAETTPRLAQAINCLQPALCGVAGDGRPAEAGATIEQANAEAQAIGANLQKEYPNENKGKSLTVVRSTLVPGQAATVGGFSAFS